MEAKASRFKKGRIGELMGKGGGLPEDSSKPWRAAKGISAGMGLLCSGFFPWNPRQDEPGRFAGISI